MITLIDAVQEAILADPAPLVTDYEVYLHARRIVQTGGQAGQLVKRLPKAWDASRTRQLLSRLDARGFLKPDPDFGSGVWRVLQTEQASPAAEAACIADPFCYVSHYSALELQGLTVETPETLQLSRPARPLWNALRDDRVAADVDRREFQDAAGLLLRATPADTLRGRPVVFHETRRPADFVTLEDGRTRVATVGDTLAAALAEPRFFGGMAEALKIWDAHAPANLEVAIAAIDRTEAKIVKVRAGYILTERLGLDDSRIDAWRTCAQRGGSRRLDPDAPYRPTFSEAWMISLNLETNRPDEAIGALSFGLPG